mmetsp:Transcript_52980/g.78543  ORF Transcript_52980/g.78543 Transcript_52980/m.78543 type:complete len:82 (+) Transcript_52980:14-259(+)
MLLLFCASCRIIQCVSINTIIFALSCFFIQIRLDTNCGVFNDVHFYGIGMSPWLNNIEIGFVTIFAQFLSYKDVPSKDILI